MSQIPKMMQVLKRLLKQQQLTYADVAASFSMSEANVKRFFSQQRLSMDRLEQLCELLDLTLSDFFYLVEKQQQKISQLTLEQEQQLVDDPKLLLVAACVRDGWSYHDIISTYTIEPLQAVRLLARLDKLNMIQLLPNNHYKLLIAHDFQWISRGPLERFIANDVMNKFLMSDFQDDNAFRFYLRGSYSASSINLIKKKLQHLKQECDELNQQDSKINPANRQHIGVLLAMRPWELSMFRQLRRRDEHSN
ncbi:helix-turn-helix transcriptional regulator [Thalassotalea litorea]|uniref:Helix-turn-helix transcriptional regulator n=1 Tax=Thalassotalea litorea TaxID=2020715 RepID=A0A5R9IM78_9GAMM|nr:helix-turn-helix transcriptional regulator [Thalassotalea litorea]TLU66650.1 helix-turn-helix transcriptional regulator [Thalassotalea litorea]